ncbi:O-antigen ligase family protein [Acidobacteriota bacterium]
MSVDQEAKKTAKDARPDRNLISRILGIVLILFVSAIPFSIFAAQSALILAIVLTLIKNKGRIPRGPDRLLPMTCPAIAYAVITLLSALTSRDVLESLADSKEIFLFLIIPVVYLHFKESPKIEKLLLISTATASVAAIWGIVQLVLTGSGLEHRVSGPLSHYMTYAGILMFVTVFITGRLLFCRTPATLFWLVCGLLCLTALLCTYSRNAWLGLVAGLVILIGFKRARYLIVLPLFIIVMVLLSPPSIKSRFSSILDPNDPSNRDRIHMGQIGLYMIGDYPILGVGPAQVHTLYPEYRRKYTPHALERDNPHLHNNFIQIGAERGILGLLAWLAFIVSFLYDRLKGLKNSSKFERAYRINGIACVSALLVAGLFEYNFGDSEVKMMLLTFMTLSYLPGPDRPFPGEASQSRDDETRGLNHENHY